MTDEDFWSIMRPKAVGAYTFDAANMPLLTEQMFSSTSAVWSQPGAGHYAAANSTLDAVAAAKHATGVPACAVQFGPFGGVGMAAQRGAALAAIGLRTLQPSEVRSSELLWSSSRSSCLCLRFHALCRRPLLAVEFGEEHSK